MRQEMFSSSRTLRSIISILPARSQAWDRGWGWRGQGPQPPEQRQIPGQRNRRQEGTAPARDLVDVFLHVRALRVLVRELSDLYEIDLERPVLVELHA